jgi:hypothetical protein
LVGEFALREVKFPFSDQWFVGRAGRGGCETGEAKQWDGPLQHDTIQFYLRAANGRIL